MAKFRVRVTVSFDAWITMEADDAAQAEQCAEELVGDPALLGGFYEAADLKTVYAHEDETEEVCGGEE